MASGLKINKSWTLFLDRDGVINEKLENDYVKKWEEFKFIDGSIEAIKILSKKFGRIIIVTNQRGIGKGVMSLEDLNIIHNNMIGEFKKKSFKITKIYFCPDMLEESDCRKPNIGMALMAKNDFPEINLKKSIMVGDSITDMQFGKKNKMKTIFIGHKNDLPINLVDFVKKNLFETLDLFL